MARRCGTKNGKSTCRKPRANWWRASMGVDWYGSSSGGLDPDYQAVLDLAEDETITTPTDPQNNIVSDFIAAIKNTTLWAKRQTANIYGIGSFEFGTLNLFGPETYRHTAVGTQPTYTALQGIKSAGAGSCINTEKPVNEYAGIESDLTVVVDVFDAGASLTTDRLMGSVLSSNTAQRLQLNTGSRSAYNAVTSNFVNTDTRGLYFLRCDGANNIIIKDKVKQTIAAAAVAPIIGNYILLLAYNIHTTGGVTVSGTTFLKNVIGYFAFDALTDEEAAIFADLWETSKIGIFYTSQDWFVRAAGGAYGTEDGTSFENAFDGDVDVDWLQIHMGHRLFVCDTLNEQLTVDTGRVTIDGGFPDHPCTINGGDARTNCILVNGISYVTIRNFILIDATTQCLGLFGPASGILAEDIECSGSGNQGVQMEGNSLKLHTILNRIISHDNTDDGFSQHGGSVNEGNDLEAYNNGQGIHAISDAIGVYNRANVHDNSVHNVRADTNADLTFNDSTFNNGIISNTSSIPIKLNNCDLGNCTLSGDFIIDGVPQTF